MVGAKCIQEVYSNMQYNCYTYMHALHYSYGMMQCINTLHYSYGMMQCINIMSPITDATD